MNRGNFDIQLNSQQIHTDDMQEMMNKRLRI